MTKRGTKYMKNFLKTLVTILTGILIAMALMSIAIYFGYTEAYATNVEKLTVKMIGIPIFKLMKTGTEYTGTQMGPNMGIICGIFIVLSFCVRGIIKAIKKAHK